jgi:hypothetical protein
MYTFTACCGGPLYGIADRQETWKSSFTSYSIWGLSNIHAMAMALQLSESAYIKEFITNDCNKNFKKMYCSLLPVIKRTVFWIKYSPRLQPFFQENYKDKNNFTEC